MNGDFYSAGKQENCWFLSWSLLYSENFFSIHHGESFSRLLKSTVNEGPCLIIVKEKNGQIFGGFSSVNLDLSPNFVGTHFCVFRSWKCV